MSRESTAAQDGRRLMTVERYVCEYRRTNSAESEENEQMERSYIYVYTIYFENQKLNRASDSLPKRLS